MSLAGAGVLSLVTCQGTSLEANCPVVAYASDVDGGFNVYDIYRTFPPCDKRRLTTGNSIDVSPAWRPDGKVIAS